MLKDAEVQMNLAGKTSEKQNLHYQLALAYTKARSEKNFYQLLQKNGLTLYERGGNISGVQGEKRRYRLKTLGYSNEKIKEINMRINQRLKEVTILRDTKLLSNEKENNIKNIGN